MGWEWLSQFLQIFANAFPRSLIVRTDERTVEFVFGFWARELRPGWYIEWPLFAKYDHAEVKRQTCRGKQRFGKQAYRWKIVYEITDALLLITSTSYDFSEMIEDLGEIALGDVYAKYRHEEMDLLDCQEEIGESIREELADYGVKLIKFAIVSASQADRQFSIWELNGTPQVY